MSGLKYKSVNSERLTGHCVLVAGAARGTAGVLSYDIAGTNHKLVVMWDVPFDRNLYNVKFNMKVRIRLKYNAHAALLKNNNLSIIP